MNQTSNWLKSETLLQASRLIKIPSLEKKIDNVLKEDEGYAADELVELAEEILNLIAAVGFIHYLNSGVQKEVYNDFLIQLFNSSGHNHNAGPLYRWSANMIKECSTLGTKHKQFFWEENEGKLILSSNVHRLAELRNAVMHGFFVLPPERNRKEADGMGALLLDLHACGFFNVPAEYHFFSKNSFTGQWNVTDELQWLAFKADTRFGQLTRRILQERTEAFWQFERSIVEQGNASNAPAEVRDFVESNTSKAFACWERPKASNQEQLYSDIGAWLYAQPEVITIAYRINDEGLSYTGQFLLQRLQELLDPKRKVKTKDKKPAEWLPAIRKAVKEKVVVLVEGIHRALFSPQHITQFNQLLQQSNIILVAVGQHHRALDRYFNAHIFYGTTNKTVLPNLKVVKPYLYNYLRFKGPSRERADEQSDAQALEKLLEIMLMELKEKGQIVARRFADELQMNIEYVHEIMDVLAPWIPLTRLPFEADTFDEIYGYPVDMTEVTPIYLALGRRDLKLEYTHKVLTIKNQSK